ncbi:hypothetical protein [Marimonas arenosa]|uniref:Uncharacterized protein n=1 Tax=Marimonas arenosa TaxID=1795305 RepID=A0AAE3WE27_9RHOB|nr:hypothetical protein [Marimonas arenosa]MDQ2090705.1 hypothetical protein [Marimonas arenosa]
MSRTPLQISLPRNSVTAKRETSILFLYHFLGRGIDLNRAHAKNRQEKAVTIRLLAKTSRAKLKADQARPIGRQKPN